MANDIISLLAEYAAFRKLVQITESLPDGDPAITMLRCGFAQCYDTLAAAQERIEGLEADAEIGELVRGMGPGTRLDAHGGTFESFEFDGTPDGRGWLSHWRCYDPAEALASIQSQTTSDAAASPDRRCKGDCEEESK